MTTAQSPFAKAMALAKRLVELGINPFQSEAERYVVLLNEGGGEILDWGKPLRGTRFFAPNAVRKDRPMVADFEVFAKQCGLQDCVFWGIGLTGAKADAADLVPALKGLNDRINVEFSELRKSGRFEMLLLVIHPRYDEASGLFDLHAHFVARVPNEYRDAVKHRLRCKFSKTDFPDSPIRKAAAVASYMCWGIFRNDVMIDWPDHALKAAWQLTESRFRFVRAAGAFARWRASKVPVEKAASNVDDEQRRRNREETADRRQKVITSDRLLSKIMVKIRGVRTPALLFEATPSKVTVDVYRGGPPEREYSSATNIVTQESAGERQTAVSPTPWAGAIPIRNRLRTHISQLMKAASRYGRKIYGIGKKLLNRLAC